MFREASWLRLYVPCSEHMQIHSACHRTSLHVPHRTFTMMVVNVLRKPPSVDVSLSVTGTGSVIAINV